jgi:hypothetical protein
MKAYADNEIDTTDYSNVAEISVDENKLIDSLMRKRQVKSSHKKIIRAQYPTFQDVQKNKNRIFLLYLYADKEKDFYIKNKKYIGGIDLDSESREGGRHFLGPLR